MANDSRCPHESDWYCKLLDKPCHPGMAGCILSGQPMVDALLAFEAKQEADESPKSEG